MKTFLFIIMGIIILDIILTLLMLREKDDKQLLLRQKRDNIKKQLCKEHNIPILYYANRKHTEDLITDASEIISLLKNI